MNKWRPQVSPGPVGISDDRVAVLINVPGVDKAAPRIPLSAALVRPGGADSGRVLLRPSGTESLVRASSWWRPRLRGGGGVAHRRAGRGQGIVLTELRASLDPRADVRNRATTFGGNQANIAASGSEQANAGAMREQLTKRGATELLMLNKPDATRTAWRPDDGQIR
jgi:phosphomannomutase